MFIIILIRIIIRAVRKINVNTLFSIFHDSYENLWCDLWKFSMIYSDRNKDIMKGDGDLILKYGFRELLMNLIFKCH